jgi:hypothetical protein
MGNLRVVAMGSGLVGTVVDAFGGWGVALRVRAVVSGFDFTIESGDVIEVTKDLRLRAWRLSRRLVGGSVDRKVDVMSGLFTDAINSRLETGTGSGASDRNMATTSSKFHVWTREYGHCKSRRCSQL